MDGEKQPGYTIFEAHFLSFSPSGEERYMKQLHFYVGNILSIDVERDWRTREVRRDTKKEKNKIFRYQSVLRGYVDALEFPVSYPIITSLGEKIFNIGYDKVEYYD